MAAQDPGREAKTLRLVAAFVSVGMTKTDAQTWAKAALEFLDIERARAKGEVCHAG